MVPGDSDLNFALLGRRLMEHLRRRVQSGELTERGLSRQLGVSQPHIHNVLKGVRFLSQDLADEVLKQLGISLMDLVKAEEIGISLHRTSPARRGEIAVPVLAERLGPGYPFPSKQGLRGFILVPSFGLEFVRDPVLVFLAPDRQVEAYFPGAAVVLLDFGTELSPAERGPAWCALSLQGGGCLRKVAQIRGGGWVVVPELDGPDPCRAAAPDELNVTGAARAIAVWVGRDFPGPGGLAHEGFLAVAS